MMSCHPVFFFDQGRRGVDEMVYIHNTYITWLIIVTSTIILSMNAPIGMIKDYKTFAELSACKAPPSPKPSYLVRKN